MKLEDGEVHKELMGTQRSIHDCFLNEKKGPERPSEEPEVTQPVNDTAGSEPDSFQPPSLEFSPQY